MPQSTPSTPISATPLKTSNSLRRNNGGTGTPTSPKQSLDITAVRIEPATPPAATTTARPRPQVNISGLTAPQATSPSTSPSASPIRTSQTHAGGILPPASFFRASRPNSSAHPHSRPPSVLRTSVISTGLPFKAHSPSPQSASPSPSPRSGLPSAFNKPPALEGRIGLGRENANRSREPLLSPVGERERGTERGTGVRKSFERIWKKGMNVGGGGGGAGSPSPVPPATSVVSGAEDSREEEEEEEDLGDKKSLAHLSNKDDLEAGPEDRNRYVQPDTDAPTTPLPDSTETEPPRRLTIDDIGDGAAGGGVVMEMGRLSIHHPPSIRSAVAQSLRSVSMSFSKRRTEDLESVNDAEIRFASKVSGPRSPTTPAAYEMHQPKSSPLVNHQLPPQEEGMHQSRHARFAPSPARTPKELESESTRAKSTSPTPPPIPHSAVTPKYMVPLLSPRTKQAIRNYEFHPSMNRWFFKGHVVTGGDSAWPFVGALLTLLGIAGTWFGTTCVFWWHRGMGGQAVAAVGAYMCALTLSSMLMTAFRDPGILPRDLDPDPPFPPASSMTSESNPVPLPRDLRVRAGSVRVKYCVTCKTYRPPRASHCKICDNCIDGCDHHCQWVNNCVGRRNYTYFITFVCAASLTSILVLVTAIMQVYLLAHDNGYSVKGALRHAVGSAVVICMCLVVMWPLWALTLYHVRLLLLNITTIEQVRNQAHRKLTNGPTPANAFHLGRWWHNVAYMVCRPPGYSWLDFSGQAMHDTRKINPGFVVRPANGDLEGEDATPRESRDRSWR